MNVAIHQIFYDDAQRRALDPAFAGWDGEGARRPRRTSFGMPFGVRRAA